MRHAKTRTDVLPSRGDPHELLAHLGKGWTTADYRKDQSVYEQGHVADRAFFIQEGRVQIDVTSERAMRSADFLYPKKGLGV